MGTRHHSDTVLSTSIKLTYSMLSFNVVVFFFSFKITSPNLCLKMFLALVIDDIHTVNK